MSVAMARKVFAALRREPALSSIHIAGGEPTLRPELLEEVIRLAREMGIPVAYMETNASWCCDREGARRNLTRWKDAGLPAILVSVSMFHNEFVPFRHTRICVETALDVFGPNGVILYLPHMYELLSRMPDDGTHSLEEFCRWAGLMNRRELIPRLYQVIPSGRATQALRECYRTRPAAHFRGETCLSELLSTSHFHIDQHGDLFTGLCAGLAPASVKDLHPVISEVTHPAFFRLCLEGPYELMGLASRQFGYREREDGYVSKCDLCFHVRKHLQETGAFPELRPAAFYTS
jgi:MoaA/NifB/PqqE/SkfB family radical SAM enzyme